MMNAWRDLRRTIAVMAAASGVAAAAGQNATYLTPVKYTAALGERVAVHVEAGEGNVVQRTAWPTHRIEWLFVRAAGTQENRENVGPADPRNDFVSVTLTKPGVTLIALDTKPFVATVTGKQFKAFAKRTAAGRSHTDAIAAMADDEQVRTRRIESAKTLVRVSDPGGGAGVPPANRPPSHSAVAQSKTGQAVEIRPLADPTMVIVGSDLPVRAYVLGSKKAGVKVLATCIATGETREALTDASGSCHFRIGDAGVWRIEFHHAEPLTLGGAGVPPASDPQADWAIYSATLTFEATRTGAGK